MGLKSKWNRGEEVPRFEFRPGTGDFPEWDGIKREMADPASIPANSVWTCINARFNGVSFASRPGQSPWNSSPETGCIYGFFDFEGTEGGGNGGAVLIGPGLTNTNSPPRGQPARYDETATTPFLIFDPGDGSDTPLHKILKGISTFSTNGFDETDPTKTFANNCFFKMNGKIYGLAGAGAAAGSVYEISYSNTVLVLRKVFDLPARANHVVVVTERDVSAAGSIDTVGEVAYISSLTGAGTVYRWSPVTGFSTEVTGGPSFKTMAIKYRENLYFLSRDSLRVRNSVGSYSNIALPAYPHGKAHFLPIAAYVYKDKLYFTGAEYDSLFTGQAYAIVFAYDGTSITVARSLLGDGTLTPCFGSSIEGGFGNMYISYAVDTLTKAHGCAIARFDGSSWNDNIASDIDDGLISTEDSAANSVLRFNGKDMLINVTPGDGVEAGAHPSLWKSAGSDFSALVKITGAVETVKCPFGDMILVDQD